MLNKIIDILSKKNLTGWQIREVRKKSYQSFLARESRECARKGETVKYRVSLFQKRKEVLGMSSFVVIPDHLSSLEKSIDDALFSASLVNNQPFELPEQPKNLPLVDIADPSLDQNSLKICEDRLLAAVSKEKKTRLSSAEFFIDRIYSRLINHKGLDLEQEETLIQTEIILLSKSGKRENEYINRYARRYLADFDLESEVSASAQFARDATEAGLPRTGSFPVLFSEEPLDHLFNPLLARASARLKYNRMLDIEVEKSILESSNPKGDSVTLWVNNILKGAVGSFFFDSFGTPSQKVCLIEKNKVKNLIADKQYADYLNIPATGEVGNVEIEGGSVPFSSLKDPGQSDKKILYHVQALSAFEPNPITGAFSAEIRAGFEVTPAGTRPIKGGSVSGILQKGLEDCIFSKELFQREKALIPKGVLFKSLEMAGS